MFLFFIIDLLLLLQLIFANVLFTVLIVSEHLFLELTIQFYFNVKHNKYAKCCLFIADII